MKTKHIWIVTGIWLTVMLAAMLGPRLWWVATDPNYYGWPAVTKCRVCDKTVWTWQSYERRVIPVEVENNAGLAVSCSMSGLMHVDCKAPPKPAKVIIESVPAPAKAEWY